MISNSDKKKIEEWIADAERWTSLQEYEFGHCESMQMFIEEAVNIFNALLGKE
jgi:hypothetical protein